MVRLVDPERRRARNYTSRREQWRLLLLILPLGLVILLMSRLRDPQVAEQVNQFFVPPANAQPTAPAPDVPDAGAVSSSNEKIMLFPGVDPRLLKTVQDNTYFRKDEADAWFNFFKSLQTYSPARLESMPRLSADYVQLTAQPNHFRGKLVTIAGTIREVSPQKPAENDIGLDTYYRVAIAPASGGIWPILVYVRELAGENPEKSALNQQVTVTGLFFKNLSYKWEDGLGTAPVIVAQLLDIAGADAKPADKFRAPVAIEKSKEPIAETKPAEDEAVDEMAKNREVFREILRIAGWDNARLEQMDDGKPLTGEQGSQSLELLRRLRSFDSWTLQEWRITPGPTKQWTDPTAFRGDLVRLFGSVTKVTPHKLEPADAERLEMAEYYECELDCINMAGRVTVLTSRVPKAWRREPNYEGMAKVNAVYVKRLNEENPPASLWVAKEIAWHPATALGSLAVDVGLLDGIEPRGSIRAEEREAFYDLLWHVRQSDAGRLIRLANDQLPDVEQRWQRELETARDDATRRLAAAAAKRAEQGRYSVAPLFNKPEDEIGRLHVFDGVARRAVRVEVGEKPDGGESDVARFYELDHYYELEVFTDDSQNYPLVFCVPSLPDGFPTEGIVDVPVRMAGFFFKDWLYRTRNVGGDEPDEAPSDPAGRPQYAPLLIGPEPVVLATPSGNRGIGQLVAAALFVAALLCVWGIVVFTNRSDYRFRQKTLAASYQLPPGESLNELNLPPPTEPMTNQVTPPQV